jgi:protein gp37
MSTTIQWTDETWNPITGCTKVSPGCAHCYIERTPAFRIAGRKFDAKAHIPLRVHDDRLDHPLTWKKPRRVFVNSLSDLFHDDIPDEFISQVFAIMALTPRHTYQVLTKRPARMVAYLQEMSADPDAYCFAWAREYERSDLRVTPLLMHHQWPLPNVWLGVSVENQHFADERIPLLLRTPAAVRFLSCEPLLGPVGIPNIYLQRQDTVHTNGDRTPYIHWVIVGGESGPQSRPFDLAWARSIVAQCQYFKVPVFVKQLGANARIRDEWNGHFTTDITLRDHKGGDPAEWPADLRVREFPA